VDALYQTFIAGFISGIFSIGLTLYSQNRQVNRYRLKIIRVIFKMIIHRFENGKSISLYGILSWINFSKFIYKFVYFFGAFMIITTLLERSKTPNFGDFIYMEFFYALIYAFLTILLPVPFLFTISKRERSDKVSHIRYILRKSAYWTNSDFVSGWILFTLLTLLIYLENIKTFGPYWILALMTYFFNSGILFFPLIIVFLVPMGKYEKKYSDSEASIFKDFNQYVNIIVHTRGSSVRGRIIGVGDELVLDDDERSGNPIAYVPWENIVFFEII
jgi:hypothetical protein